MRSVAAKLRDPFTASVVVLSVMLVLGFAAAIAAWRGAAASLVVAVQLPYLISGVMGGLGVAGMAIALLAVQRTRRFEAERRAEFDRVIRAAAGVLAAVREGAA